MDFITSLFDTFQIIITVIGALVAIVGIVNLLEGYGEGNGAAKSQGFKLTGAGAGIIFIAFTLIPKIPTMFG